MRIRRIMFMPLLALMLLVVVLPVQAKEITGLKAEASSWKEWGVPGFMVDGDPATAWVGGYKGVGPGKTLSFKLPGARKIGMIRIANGNQGEGVFEQFRCITRGLLVLHDKGVHSFSLKPQAGEQDIVFPSVAVRSFEIIITEVYPAPGDSKIGDAKVAVSEVRVFSGSDKGAKTNVVPPSTAEVEKPKPTSKPGNALNKMSYFSATKPGAVYLRASVPATGSTVESGVVDPLVGEEFVTLVHGYFSGLVSMNDEFLDVFASSIRIRELEAFVHLQDEMRSKEMFDRLHSAEVDTSGISLDKPIVRGDAAMLRAHGVCRYVMLGKTYAFPVDALFSFDRSGGPWLINGVQDKLK